MDDALLGAVRALQIRDHPLTIACLELFAASIAARGDHERAATVLGAAEAARTGLGIAPDDGDAEVLALALESVGSGRASLEPAWQRGRSLDLPAAVEVAKGGDPARSQHQLAT